METSAPVIKLPELFISRCLCQSYCVEERCVVCVALWDNNTIALILKRYMNQAIEQNLSNRHGRFENPPLPPNPSEFFQALFFESSSKWQRCSETDGIR